MSTLGEYAQEIAFEILHTLTRKYPSGLFGDIPLGLRRADEHFAREPIPAEDQLWFWQEVDRQLYAQRPFEKMNDAWDEQVYYVRRMEVAGRIMRLQEDADRARRARGW